jgi:hypothetical protein
MKENPRLLSSHGTRSVWRGTAISSSPFGPGYLALPAAAGDREALVILLADSLTRSIPSAPAVRPSRNGSRDTL